jgi:hypothetical protein
MECLMKKLTVLEVILLLAIPVFGDDPVRVVLTPSSTISSGEILKSMEKKCVDVTLTMNAEKADFLLEAIATPRSRKNYELALFNKEGDVLFHSGTVTLGAAVKDICQAIHSKKK